MAPARFVLLALLSLLASAAHADLPDCYVLLRTDNSAQHPTTITVAPGTAVGLEAHCRSGPNDPAPAFAWSNGATSFQTALTAGAAGESRALDLTVTQGGASATYRASVVAAAADTPACTLSVTGANAPVFRMQTVHASCPGATSYVWSSLLDIRGQGTDTVEVFDLDNVSDPGFATRIDVAGVNDAGRGAPTGTGLAFTLAAPACRIDPTPIGTVASGTHVNFDAVCDGDPNFWTWGPVASHTASLAFNPTANGNVLMVAYGPSLIANTLYSATLVGAPPPLRNYTAAWWGGGVQGGWGLTINQHEDRIFAVLYLDDPAAQPSFVVLAGGSWDPTHTAFTGALYVPQSSWLGAYDASEFDPKQSVGNMTLRFVDASTIDLSATLAYGAAEPPLRPFTTNLQRRLIPLVIDSGGNPTGNNYGDLWWGGAAENGWGLSITQMQSLTFAAWYTYDRSGRATWYVLQSSTWSGETLTGPILKVSADPLLARDFTVAHTASTTVGNGTLRFTDANHGVFSYTVDGVTQEKAIERLAF